MTDHEPSLTLARRPDWRPRLTVYLAAASARPFAYGQHDCALFVAGAVNAMTGVDLADRYRGLYTSLKGGLKLLQAETRLGPETAPLDLLRRNFRPVHPAFANVGDIAVIGEVGIPALGLFAGEHLIVLRETGLGHMPREAATMAWVVD